MRSDGPFTATLWGWSRYASYAYLGGMAQRTLVDTALPPIRRDAFAPRYSAPESNAPSSSFACG